MPTPPADEGPIVTELNIAEQARSKTLDFKVFQDVQKNLQPEQRALHQTDKDNLEPSMFDQSPEKGKKVKNPCINHPYNHMEYIDHTEKTGICSECIYEHYQLGHKIFSIGEVEKDVRQLLMNLERDTLDIL